MILLLYLVLCKEIDYSSTSVVTAVFDFYFLHNAHRYVGFEGGFFPISQLTLLYFSFSDIPTAVPTAVPAAENRHQTSQGYALGWVGLFRAPASDTQEGVLSHERGRLVARNTHIRGVGPP